VRVCGVRFSPPSGSKSGYLIALEGKSGYEVFSIAQSRNVLVPIASSVSYRNSRMRRFLIPLDRAMWKHLKKLIGAIKARYLARYFTLIFLATKVVIRDANTVSIAITGMHLCQSLRLLDIDV
jgi:hypothetical protein